MFETLESILCMFWRDLVNGMVKSCLSNWGYICNTQILHPMRNGQKPRLLHQSTQFEHFLAVHCGHPWRALHHESWGWTSPHSLHRKELHRQGEGDLGKDARPRPGPLGGLSLLNVQQTPVEHPVNKSVFTTTSKSIFSRTYYNQDHLLYKHFSGVWPYLL